MNWKGMRVLVTGGAGFIGSFLVDKLVELGAETVVVDDLSRGRMENLSHAINKIRFVRGDLRDPTVAEEACNGIEICFHLASIVGGVKRMTVNQAMSAVIPTVDRNVLEACRKRDVRRVLYTSTACVYPTFLQTRGCVGMALKEDEAWSKGAMPESIYGWAKLFGEHMATAYHKEYGLGVAIVRDFNVYGGREDSSPEASHVIPALIRRAIERQNPYVVWGSGEQSRSFVYVTDVVNGMILAAEKISDAAPVNLGTKELIKIGDLARMIVDMLHYDVVPTFDETQPTGVFTRCPDLSRATELLHWEPKVKLRDGIAMTIDWYLKEFKR